MATAQCEEMAFTQVKDGKCQCDSNISEPNYVQNNCMCQEGFFLDLEGRNCVTECPSNTKPVTQERYCRCDTNTVLHPNQKYCIQDNECKGLGQIDRESFKCKCIGGAIPDENEVCKCEELVNLQQNGCVSECPENASNVNSVCSCNAGYGRKENICVLCHDGFVTSESGICSKCSNDTIADLSHT